MGTMAGILPITDKIKIPRKMIEITLENFLRNKLIDYEKIVI